MNLHFKLQLPEAIWWPDCFGDGYEDDVLDVIMSGKNSVFLYFEDYLNYTAIVNGKYIISGFQDRTKIGDWLVDINVFGSIGNVKAIACTFIQKVDVFKESDLIGPDGLDIKKCYYKSFDCKKL